MKKRILSILTAFSIMITMFIPVLPVNAELGIKNELQVSLLAALNIVPGYPSSYDADANVSAKDYVSYAYRLVGITTSDMSAQMKSFGLDDESETISPEAALKVLTNVIGYDKMLSIYGNNYFSLASQMGITAHTNIYASNANPVTYDDMVMMFYNTLTEVKALVSSGSGSYSYSDETIMEYYLNIYDDKGIVNANNTLAIDGGSTTGLDEVRIDNDNYLVGNTITEHLIGSNVKFYYYDDGERTLKWIEADSSKNKTVVVYGYDVEYVSTLSVTYDNGKNSKNLKLDSDYIIIYNGKAVTDGSVGIEAVRSMNSQNYFIDNDNSGKYNIIVINDYEYYLVDAFSKDTYTVNDYSAKTSIELDDADRLNVYDNGVKTTADAIKTGSVIAVAKSADSSVISVEILSGTVSGEITGVSTDEITVSGTVYTVSPSYAGDVLKIGRNGTFYFDNYGRIVRCVGLKEASSQYGYLLNFYRDNDPTGDCYTEILTAEGTRETFTAHQSLVVNGEKCTLDAAMNRVQINQLVTYKVSADKKITKINTADTSYIGSDTSTDDFSIHFKGAGKYRKNNVCFNSKYLLESSTPIFVVPYSGEKKDYAVIDSSSLVNNTTYDISVYDIDDYMYASCVVLKENFTEPENLRSKRSIIITSVYTGVDDDDEQIIGIKGYQQGGLVTYTTKSTEMKDNRGRYYVRDLKAGDVIQIAVDVNNDVRAVQLLFKANERNLAIASGTESPNKYWEGGTLVMPDLTVCYGTVTDRNATVLLVDSDGDESVISKDPFKFGSSTNVFIYENGDISLANKSDIFAGDTVYVQEYQGNLHEVIIVR